MTLSTLPLVVKCSRIITRCRLFLWKTIVKYSLMIECIRNQETWMVSIPFGLTLTYWTCSCEHGPRHCRENLILNVNVQIFKSNPDCDSCQNYIYLKNKENLDLKISVFVLFFKLQMFLASLKKDFVKVFFSVLLLVVCASLSLFKRDKLVLLAVLHHVFSSTLILFVLCTDMWIHHFLHSSPLSQGGRLDGLQDRSRNDGCQSRVGRWQCPLVEDIDIQLFSSGPPLLDITVVVEKKQYHLVENVELPRIYSILRVYSYIQIFQKSHSSQENNIGNIL